jgi:large subunit ribosomal protein L29
MMKAASLREQTDAELRQLEADLTRELFERQTQKGGVEGSEQPLRVRTVRRDIARVKTILGERERKSHA